MLTSSPQPVIRMSEHDESIASTPLLQRQRSSYVSVSDGSANDPMLPQVSSAFSVILPDRTANPAVSPETSSPLPDRQGMMPLPDRIVYTTATPGTSSSFLDRPGMIPLLDRTVHPAAMPETSSSLLERRGIALPNISGNDAVMPQTPTSMLEQQALSDRTIKPAVMPEIPSSLLVGHGIVALPDRTLSFAGTPETPSPLLDRQKIMSLQDRTMNGSIMPLSDQQMYVMGFMEQAAIRIPVPEKNDEENKVPMNNRPRRMTESAFVTILSAMYAKLLVVLGIAFPVTEVLSHKVPESYYEGFYLYLYLGSLTFICFLYAMILKERAVKNIISKHRRMGIVRPHSSNVVRYGSFYLRLGAIGFGIGSMVYSGLEFGQYFTDTDCDDTLLVLRPAFRMLLTLVQIQFLYLNNKDMKMGNYAPVARFGLMHMVATNVCEWLYVLVEETKHEIVHLIHHDSPSPQIFTADLTNGTDLAHNSSLLHRIQRNAPSVDPCARTNIMGTLVQNASTFLFPCTIEYSLICAVTLYEMWKHIKVPEEPKITNQMSTSDFGREHRTYSFGGIYAQHRFSVDCHGVYKGMFAGILTLVLTIISLVLFFVLQHDKDYTNLAVFEVSVCEMVLYVISALAVLACMLRMRILPPDTEAGHGRGLDNSLLVMAQAGMFVYCTFSIIGFHYMDDEHVESGMITEIIALIQTMSQTTMVLYASKRRCRTKLDKKRKPGRQLVTFLIVANMAMWMINTLEKGHAEFRPSHLKFFGMWAWTIITHVSMPLAIFYRFHSTICLFEIWKSAYKLKPQQ